ncbi:unnamed protein product [Arabidopsis lyrata]|uniref:Predicted protein n=1 Tax=Arabidopsis lyrata subsp. lyrata TaxID=81972 RepID=D7LMY2_ARALL|nr:uncharacterized protein At1g24485 [Arabidopsis lyrata subsp. lyrata]EFH53729.1 predicted protein [Arabidopsis lyrata subsp. lyrata]CAH8267622.1 unnamed protein product [Arabidopsis lyrata]|eukprot:XP_002877470.1 uncharacterized protein At1g24485 [Arabidopsis lyrata subsp. lyrata]
MAAPALYLLFFLSIITLSLASVNIDCGTSASGIDNNNIRWVGDTDLITTGKSSTVLNNELEKSLSTLRYFPSGKSNCYSKIPLTKGGKVLIRTVFYYGNYDRKSSFPTFDVLFDGKHLGTASILSSFDPYLLEVIFSPASSETSVCFLRTSSSNPFVSSIEIVELDSGMYNELGPGEGLFYQQRIAYGATIGLRSDLHGRFWFPSGSHALYRERRSRATLIDTSGASNQPPEIVLRKSWSGDGLVLGDPTLPSGGVPVYLAMYFSEPIDTLSSRSFNIFLDGKQVNESPIEPVFGETIQVVVKNVVANSTTELEFRSTASSFYPPLINAVELYVISTGTSVGGGGGGGFIEEKNSKLPIILGVVAAVALLLIAFVVIIIILANRHKARMKALAMPTSTVANMETGSSPQSEEQMGHNLNQPANEAGQERSTT